MSEERRTPRLFELLAVEPDRKGNAERSRSQTVERFRKNQNHFSGMRRTFKPFAVDEAKGEVAGERLEAETQLVATVPEELRETLKAVAETIDIGLQVDDANTRAKADLVVDGEVLATDLPATFLLQLEKRLREVRVLFKELPTYDPVRTWSVDAGADKPHTLRAEPVVTIRKQRTRKYNVMYEATKEHPAQIDVVEVDDPVGEIRTYDWTGMVSPGRKTQLIERLDALIAEVKRARSRANTVEIDTGKKLAEKLIGHLLKPLD